MQQISVPQSRPIHWPSLFQFALSALAILMLVTQAGGLLLLALTNIADAAMLGMGTVAMGSFLQLLLLTSGSIAVSVLIIPSALTALMRLMGRAPWEWRPSQRRQTGLAISALVIYALAMLTGAWLENQGGVLPAIAMPLLQIPAILVPAGVFVWLGARRLDPPGAQRQWGSLAAGLTLGPLLALILEIGVLVGLFVVVVAALLSDPQAAADLEQLAQRLTLASPDPDTVLRLLQPYLLTPLAGVLVLGFGAGVVAIIEELVKPVGVWLLAGKNLSPAQGFQLGLLSGAGFAIYENVTLGSAVEGWAPLLLARSGTALLHVLSAGLMGWGLAHMFTNRKWLNLITAYLAAMFIHAAWNGLTLVNAGMQMFGSFMPDMLPDNQVLRELPAFLMAVLGIGMFATLLLVNRRLRPAPAVTGLDSLPLMIEEEASGDSSADDQAQPDSPQE